MDTRFWGPSGWKLLHTITFLYEPSQATEVGEFLAVIPYILPCKFCRYSLTEYYEKHPYEEALRSRAALARWMYTIHNCVNAKLRGQGLNPSPDPSFAAVQKFYTSWLKDGLAPCIVGTFWDFLFAVAYNHPKEASRNSSPMSGCPDTCTGDKEKNRWNTMTADERMPYYRRFWQLLPAILPGKWSGEEAKLGCRKSAVAWLWRQRCQMDPSWHDPYQVVCERIASHASGCSASRRARTCRRRQQRVTTRVKKPGRR